MSLYTFNKDGYTDEAHIQKLYDRKIELLLAGRSEDELNQREAEIVYQLRQNRNFDPRYPYICFGLEKEAKIGTEIADNLEKLSDQEFMVSSYPYEWMYKLEQKTICRMLNEEGKQVISKVLSGQV